MNGAKALAIPTRYGQELCITESTSFEWLSVDEMGETRLHLNHAESSIAKTQEEKTLIEILSSIKGFVPRNRYKMVADFPKDWGLGSSSTLLAVLSDYYGVDPYVLNQQVFHGSGYDIACAFSETPIMYRIHESKPHISSVHLEPRLTESIYFAYLGRKQNSKEAIQHFQHMKHEKEIATEMINEITEEILDKQNYPDWLYLLDKHEELIAKTLKLERVKDNILKGFPFFSKSLGAWGGDFIMILSDAPYTDIKTELNKKNLQITFPYIEIIKAI